MSEFKDIYSQVNENHLQEKLCLDEKSIEDQLIANAIDLHAHGFPEVSLNYRGRIKDYEWAKIAQELKMGGFVIKSHIWPTMERAYMLQCLYPKLRIYGSITLNPNVGGLSAWAVQSAIQLGAKVIWFPTWGAKYDIEKYGGKYFRSYLPFIDKIPSKGIILLEDSGDLKSEVKEIIERNRFAVV